MMTRNIRATILAGGLLLLTSLDGGAQVNVTTWHNDLARTGANTQESTLTTANVNFNTFGKLFSTPVDGQVVAQPLYLSNVSIGGGTHNVVYIATEHDSVYAIDADSGTIYAHVSLIPPGGTTVNSTSDLNCGDINPEVGITGTPVIDPANHILYVVSKAKVSGNILQQLHALSTISLAEELNGPVEIDGSVPGTAPDGNGTTVVFSPLMENQRPGLALTNGHVVIGWSSHCDNQPYHGWLMSYSASTLSQEAVWNSTPDSEGTGNPQSPQGGIWMAGAAPAVDASGNLYVTSGNGYWNGVRDFSDTVLKLGPPANDTFPLLDWFTPFDQGGIGDSDVGSAGPILFPTTTSGAQLLVQQGKQGTIYLVNRSDLGHDCASLSSPCSTVDIQIPEELRGATPGVLSSPIYWNGNVFWQSFSNLFAWSVNPSSGLISQSPTSQSAQTFDRTAAVSLSANGATNGILWLMQNTAELFAFDATNLANILWTSAQAANGRDRIDSAVKFEPPTIVNGKVYYGTADELVVLGLLESQQNWTSGGSNTVNFSSLGQATVLSSLTIPTNRSITLNESALVTSPSNAAVTFTLYNSSGTAVGSFSSANSSSLTLSGLPPGTYSLLVTPAAGATGSVQLTASFLCSVYARADFNDDCKSDILWRNADGTVNTWLMNGASISSSATVAVMPNPWTISGIGDFNGDGYADILWTNTNGTVNVWLMDAANIKSSATVQVVATTWTVAGVGDFNGDGKADILWRNSNGDVVIWFMNGEAILSSADLGVIPTSWTVAGIGDFNDDGHADILWRNSNGDTVIWFMNGGTIESSTDLGVVPTTWSIAGTGDFNGDGTADILWRNSDGAVVVWLINSGTITSSSNLGVIPLSWVIARTGDFNGDGTSDILWRNSNGDTVIWFISGGAISSSADLGVIPTSWTIVPTGQ